MDFSYAFDKVLNDFGISGKWLASESGVSEVIISRIRKGASHPTTKTLGALLDALPDEVKLHYFSLVLNSSIKPAKYELDDQIQQLTASEKANLFLNHFEADLLTPEQQAKLLLKLSQQISTNLNNKSLTVS